MRGVVFFSSSSKKAPYPFLKLSKVNTLKKLDKLGPSIVIVDVAALNKKEPLDVADYPNHVFIAYGNPDNSLLLRKAVSRGNYTDFLTFSSSKQEVSFILQRAGFFLALKKENFLLRERAEQCEHMDTEVGCYNWRFFARKVPQEIKKSRERKYPLSFIIIDIDYFRQINQSYGYACADQVMKDVAVITSRMLSPDSFFIRGRDDSFVIVIPHLAQPKVHALAHKIKNKLSRHAFKFRKVLVHISLSMGIVSLPENGIKNYRDVINALECALIFSKRKGGNSVTYYSQALKDREKTIKQRQEKEPDIDSLKRRIHHLNKEMNQNLLDMIYGFAKAIEVRDMSTANHVEGVALIARKIAERLKLPGHQIEDVYYAAMLHDLGKIGVSPEIICKKGKLDKKEWEIIKTHPWVATEILREIHILRGALPAILYHHEHWNGSGYPFGLKGEEIPLIARIVAIADVYEALTSDRPYRKAFSKKQALKIIREESGRYFDPFIVEVFLEIVEKKKK